MLRRNRLVLTLGPWSLALTVTLAGPPARRIADINRDSESPDLIGFVPLGQGTLLCTRSTSGYAPSRLRWSDGTAAGTRLLGEIEISYRSPHARIGHRVIFTGRSGGWDWEPWTTDGTTAFDNVRVLAVR